MAIEKRTRKAAHGAVQAARLGKPCNVAGVLSMRAPSGRAFP